MYYAFLDGQFPCLSLSELMVLVNPELTGFFTQLILFRTSKSLPEIIDAQTLSSTIKEIGDVKFLSNANYEEFKEKLHQQDCPKSKNVGIYFKRVQAFSKHIGKEKIINLVRSWLRYKCKVNPVYRPKEKLGTSYSLIITDGIILFGKCISKERKGDLLKENPHDLPYYSPGALNKWFARLVSNLSLSTSYEKSVFIDPYCGTGTIAIEATSSHSFLICGDLNKSHVKGSMRNLKEKGKHDFFDIVRWDARFLPLRKNSIDSLSTDMPYGKSVKGLGGTELELLKTFLEELPIIMKEKGRAVFLVPSEWERHIVIKNPLKVIRKCPMYVHNQLTRMIYLVEKR